MEGVSIRPFYVERWVGDKEVLSSWIPIESTVADPQGVGLSEKQWPKTMKFQKQEVEVE